MKTLTVALITLSVVCLSAGVAVAKPDASKKENHGAIAKAAAHEAKAQRANRKAMQGQEQKHARGISDPGVPSVHAPRSSAPSMKSAEKALAKLNRARWAYNPNDTRGQGNMGQVNMLDPYGHDKDSDRLELYGNRGRVIRETPEPPPVEPPAEPPVEPPQEEDPPVEPPPDWPPF